MLRRLYIRDFVIVDRLELDFPSGFGALTGETGAGKSILIDALSLALGERADATVIRTGAERAEIAAEFAMADDGSLANWLRDNDFDTEESCLLRRVIDSNGRSRSTINGSPATLAQLRQAAEFLVDIHGQHAHHALLRPDAQRDILDSQIGAQQLLVTVAQKYRHWQNHKEALENAQRDVAAAVREQEIVDWQVKELQALAFEPGQWQEDNQEQRRLAHAAGLLEGVTAALALLNEDEYSIRTQLAAASGQLRPLLDYDAALQEPAALLEAAAIQLDEAGHTLSRYRERLELEPERLSALEARIDAVTAAARKHRIAPDGLPSLLAGLEKRQAELSLAADPAALAAQVAAARADYLAVAQRLTAARQAGAAQLSSAVSAAMQQLAMAGGSFEVALLPVEQGSSHGQEDVQFLVAANPGQTPRPLAKVASGGELSRIGLAIQVIASSAGKAPTLIFDEVDVGIGGRVAEIVGQMLRQLSRQRQVMCVTHLPQVAAQADWQWSISKQTRNDVTLSHVQPLDQAARIEEIARMLGGVKITETTRRHAREMLQQPAIPLD